MTPHPAYSDALDILRRLEVAGYEAFFVGGAARDLLLNREPHDLDIVTNAPPTSTQQLFPHHTPVGAEFGVVGVITDHGVVDVATYRSEADYADRRRPATVAWSSKETDVRRRDFTVNGLLYDPTQQQVVDLVDGERDLKLGLIRAIGDPVERFREDPVRMLRAVRLKAQLTFQYDPRTYQAIKPLAGELAHVANERVRTELDRMLALPSRADALTDLDELGLLEQVLPEVAHLRGIPQPRQYHREGDVFDHTMKAIGSLEIDAPLFLVWATLLHDVAKPQVIEFDSSAQPTIRTPDHAQRSAEVATRIAERLAFTRYNRETIAWLIEHHMSLKHIESMRPAKREQFLLDPFQIAFIAFECFLAADIELHDRGS